MKSETAERLAIAMERAVMQVSGGSSLEKSSTELLRFFAWLTEGLQRFRSFEAVREELLEMNEPSPAALALFEATLRLGPSLAESWLKTGAQSFLADTRTSTGRPNAIAPDQYWSICTEVSDCELKGASHGEAKKLVAKRYRVHARTIERIWQTGRHTRKTDCL